MVKKKKKTALVKAKSYPILKRRKKGVSYLSIVEVARRLKVPLPTVYGWVSRGLFRGMTKDSTNHWMIPSENLRKPSLPDWHYLSSKSKSKKKRLRSPITYVKSV